jgi:Domain of unknown function (DUF4340)
VSSKQLLRLAAVLLGVLVLWGAVALASRRSERENRSAGILPQLDTSAVDTVRLAAPSDTVILIRTKSATTGWLANDHPADKQAVSGLLKALADTSVVTELVARNPSSHGRLRVTDDSGRRVRVSQGARTMVDLIAGKPATEGDGIYLRRSGTPEVYVVRGDLGQALTRSRDEWRNHTIATVVPDSVASVEVRRGSRGYTLRRKGSGWVFGTGAPADSSAVSRLLSAYREVKVTGFATKVQEDSVRRQRSRRRARLLDRNAVPILSLVFDSLPSGLWVRSGEGREAYRLDSYTADQLTPAESSLSSR